MKASSYLIAGIPIILTSCTISFQNIDTHGTATDLVDENQAASPNVSPNISVPVSVLPTIPEITNTNPTTTVNTK